VREEEDEFAALLAVLGLPSSLDDLLLSPPSGGGALSRLIAEWLDDFFSFHAARHKRDLADADADEAGSTVRFPLPAEPLLAPALPYELDRCASFRFRLRFRSPNNHHTQIGAAQHVPEHPVLQVGREAAVRRLRYVTPAAGALSSLRRVPVLRLSLLRRRGRLGRVQHRTSFHSALSLVFGCLRVEECIDIH
jgi:hypothetical protein